MNKLLLFPLLSLILLGTIPLASAAQLDANINPNNDSSQFNIKYLKTIYLKYPDGGQLANVLQGKENTISGSADFTNPGVRKLADDFNTKMAFDGSWASITDLSVDYTIYLKSIDDSTSIDYNIEIDGTLTNYLRYSEQDAKGVDLVWRGLSSENPVIIDDHEINFPINTLRQMEPEAFDIISNTEGEKLLQENLINGDFILKQPMKNWHSLFDPTGINVDAATFGLDKSISGFLVTSFTMGESSIREGIITELENEVEFTVDKDYSVKTIQSGDSATIRLIGYAIDNFHDGTEIASVTPEAPDDVMDTATGTFPTHIILGMAAMAAIGGIGFFVFSNRSMKNQNTGQTGIDPKHLVAYETSSSSGGYQTNRGESYLKSKDDSKSTAI